MDFFRDLYQQLILDHNQNPRNFREIEHASHSANGHNPLCGDQLEVFLSIEDNMIKDIAFQGSGCAISKASASIMTSELKNKTVLEAEQIFDKFHTMITEGNTDDSLGKLSVLSGVHQYPSRVKCAILAWHTAMGAVNKTNNSSISTE
jgi:nitrogen fixation NifU-like protein